MTWKSANQSLSAAETDREIPENATIAITRTEARATVGQINSAAFLIIPETGVPDHE